MDSVKRQLRDGIADGVQAPAILLRDTVDTKGGLALLKHLVRSLCDNIARGSAQARGVVVVALSGSPESYANIHCADGKDNGPVSWFQLLDCYTDPLGWERTIESNAGHEVKENPSSPRVCRNVRDLDWLLPLVLELGRGSVSFQARERFVVIFDSMSVLLRYHSLEALMNFLCVLRSNEQISALLWLVHADLHEPRTILSFEYFSTTIIHVEPFLEVPTTSVDTVDTDLGSSRGGLMRIRQKRRNGRIREQAERFCFTSLGLSFGLLEKNVTPLQVSGKSSIPKVQFNLSLTEKEVEDRSKVVLPFEHQGNGQESKIYDGREHIKSSYLALEGRDTKSTDDHYELNDKGFGEIHYLRDSDDERPDSDEDPDDDLDI